MNNITGKDILNLVCAYKIVETTVKGGYYVFKTNTRESMECALNETIEKYRKQLKEG